MSSKNKIIQELENEQLKKDVPDFAPGDTVVVQVRVVEGERSRLQAYEGVVIAKKNRGLHSSFTVRKMSGGIGVERVFPFHSPVVQRIEIVKVGISRRSKLYYLRDLSGKKARISYEEGDGIAGVLKTPTGLPDCTNSVSSSSSRSSVSTIASNAAQLRAARPMPPYTTSVSGCSATSGARLFINIRIGASVLQCFATFSGPVRARTVRAFANLGSVIIRPSSFRARRHRQRMRRTFHSGRRHK